MLAAGVVVALLALAPLAYLVIRATGVTDGSLDLVFRARTAEVVANTLVMALLVGLGAIAIGLPTGWLTARTDLPFRRAFAVLVIVPFAVPSYVLAFAVIGMLGPSGSLASALEPIGIQRLPDIYGLPGAVLVLTLATYPYVTLAVRAAVMRLDPALLEAARTLGDDERRAFRRVVLPALIVPVTGGALLAVLYALADFGSVSLLQFDSLSRAIYVQYRATFDRSLAAVLALMLAGLALSIAFAEARLRARRPATVARARARPMQVVRLGAWRWPGALFCAAVVLLGLVLPVGTLIAWLVAGLTNGEPLRVVPEAILNTLLAGVVAVLVALVLAVPIALLAARWPGRASGAVETASMTTYALPGIVVALSVVFLATGVVPFLYQTLALLALAYAVRYLPQLSGPLRDGLRGVPPSLEESARVLGRGPASAFSTVTLPLLRPAIVAGAALVFLSVAKELPMTLILAPTGFSTLATQVWGAVGDGFYARAAAPALLLVALSMGSVALLLRGERRGREQ
ncbi:MAG TPA: iron ABC transporter permease [Candidatus Limnocylindrales bacterium]|nr:iron ABC transporter permease [Candidatus Limnocylindrales bacterium]